VHGRPFFTVLDHDQGPAASRRPIACRAIRSRPAPRRGISPRVVSCDPAATPEFAKSSQGKPAPAARVARPPRSVPSFLARLWQTENLAAGRHPSGSAAPFSALTHHHGVGATAAALSAGVQNAEPSVLDQGASQTTNQTSRPIRLQHKEPSTMPFTTPRAAESSSRSSAGSSNRVASLFAPASCGSPARIGRRMCHG
jgi:hypothetical protein